MRQLSPLLSTLTNSLRTPLRPILNNANITPSTISPGLGLNLGSSSPRPFSTTPTLLKKKVVSKPDRRVSTFSSPPSLRLSLLFYSPHPSVHPPTQLTNDSPNPLLPPPSQNTPPSPILPKPIPPTLDDPSCVAPVSGSSAESARERSPTPVAGYGGSL